jgi:hypothetical protein
MVRQHSLWFSILFLCAASAASANPITYDVLVNTSSISGTAGSLDFNFNPGPLVTQAADLQVLAFSSNGTLESCASNVQGFCNTGDVTGTLPGTLTFDNGTGFNDYFTGFTFGTTLSFDVSLYGPALSAPNGTATSGSTFAFSIFSDAAGTIPVLTTDTGDGFAFTVGVNLDGSTTLTSFSSQTTVTPQVTSAPEPNSFAPLGAALACLVVLRLRGRMNGFGQSGGS